VLQKIAHSVGNLLFELDAHHVTHTYTVVFHFCQLENIDFLVLRYLNTSVLLLDGFSEEWLFDEELYCSCILGTAIGTGSTWKLLQLQHGQDVES